MREQVAWWIMQSTMGCCANFRLTRGYHASHHGHPLRSGPSCQRWSSSLTAWRIGMRHSVGGCRWVMVVGSQRLEGQESRWQKMTRPQTGGLMWVGGWLTHTVPYCAQRIPWVWVSSPRLRHHLISAKTDLNTGVDSAYSSTHFRAIRVWPI